MNEQEPADVRWTQVGPASWRCAPLTGDLAEDGAVVAVTRTAALPGLRSPPSTVAGERRAAEAVPVLGALGVGCTRGHALRGVLSSWAEVGVLYATAANAARNRDPVIVWDERLADMRARQAARATWLSGRARSARSLALAV